VNTVNNVSKTLYIPLYGKAYVSRRGLFLADKKAEEIWAQEGFALRGKARSKWLAFYMGIRSAVFDDWLRCQLAQDREATVLHIGCGMDSRVLRVGTSDHPWYDVDFSDVIRERQRWYTPSEQYHMVAGDARNADWLATLPHSQRAIVVMEGLSMYLTAEELQNLLAALAAHFGEVALLMDCYTPLAAKLSRWKNPVHDVGVGQVYGVGDPEAVAAEGLPFLREHDMTPQRFIDQLAGREKRIFQKLYAGAMSHKLYRLYEYGKN
jgi:O-methyltransferase involved in polyketide biosynthesis